MSRIITALALLALAGCGTEGPNGPDQSTGGIFLGEITPSGAATPNELIGLADDTGFGFFVDTAAGTIYGFQSIPDGRVLAADFRAYSLAAAAVPGTLSGTIAERTNITGFATSTRGNETFSLTYQAAAYEQPSSLLLIAGDYQAVAGALSSFSIGSDGVITASDGTGCSFTGVVSVPNASFNLYRINGSNACPGLPAQLLSGLASYTPQVDATPPGLVLIYSDGVEYAVAADAQRL